MSNTCKHIFFSGLLLVMFQLANGQSFINNDSVKFKVLRRSMIIKSEKEIIPVTYLVRVDLSSEQRNICKKIKKEEWIKLLSDDKTDWAANLILYDLYKADAISYSGNLKSRDQWIQYKKQEDLVYWKSRIDKEEIK